MPRPKKYDYDAIIREHRNGYDTAEIAERTGIPRKNVQDILYKCGLKPNPPRSVQDKLKQKADKKRQEAARIERFKAVIDSGGSYKEAGKVIGLSKKGAEKFGTRYGIRSQNKGVAILANTETISRYCEECGFAYVGGYSGAESRIKLRCLTCGTETERSMISVRHRNVLCSVCKASESALMKEINEALDAEDARKKQDVKDAARIMRKYREREHENRQDYYERVFIPPAWLGETYTCKCCSREYRPIETGYNSKNYCSERCQKRLYDRKQDVKRDHRKRWRKHDKGITLDALYARDHGICYLCGGTCDYSDMSINDGVFIAGNNYPSIDHVQPLAKGGTHTWDNVKLAHRICNSIKSDREVATNDADEADSGDRRASRKEGTSEASQRRKEDADRHGNDRGYRYRIRPCSA